MLFLNKTKKLSLYLVSLILLFTMANVVFAQTIVIKPNTVVSFSKTYDNATLDLSNGSFIIKNNATLKITNSNILGSLSIENPVLFTVDGSGSLVMHSDQVNITAVNIPQHPTTQSLEYVIKIARGNANLQNNSFKINQPFAAGLFVTEATIPTTGITIKNNTVSNFHGVFYLINSDNVVVSNNTLTKNTYGNIVIIGNNGSISGNTIQFSGSNQLGNSIDVINSDTMSITNNLLLTPTCHGIYVLGSRNITISGNRVFGGITYAMNVLSFPETQAKDDYVTKLVIALKLKDSLSSNITITNNFMSQNRYGIAVSDVDSLMVNDNYFIQRFSDIASRKFWTDNSILLKNVTNLVWTDNLYKEAFTQDINGDNSKSLRLVPFPKTGGITL